MDADLRALVGVVRRHPVVGHDDGRIVVADAAGNRVRCRQFRLIPTSPKFRCTIAAASSAPGFVSGGGDLLRQPHDLSEDARLNFAIPA